MFSTFMNGKLKTIPLKILLSGAQSATAILKHFSFKSMAVLKFLFAIVINQVLASVRVIYLQYFFGFIFTKILERFEVGQIRKLSRQSPDHISANFQYICGL